MTLDLDSQLSNGALQLQSHNIEDNNHNHSSMDHWIIILMEKKIRV